MQEEEIKEIKKIVRSLLLSTKHGLTINELCSEYACITCKALPYKELGYFSAVDLIKDMPDVVRPTFLSGGVMLLRGIADSTTAHISALVRRQRSTGKNSRIVPIQQEPKATKTIVPNFIRSKILDLITCYPKGIDMRLFENAYRNQYGSRLLPGPLGFTSVRSLLDACADIIAVKVCLDQIFLYPIHLKGHQVQVQAKPLIKPLIEQSFLKPKIGVPDTLKMEIYSVLKRRANGVWVARFPIEYKEMHKKIFDVQALGFSSIVELMSKLPDLINIKRPVSNGDWLLSAKANDKNIQSEHLHYALSNEAELDELIDIYLSYIIDPSTFWFQHATHVAELEDLMEDMNEFYHSPEAVVYTMTKESANVNKPCCALYEDGQWYRAVITKYLSQDNVQVFYVDYGNALDVQISSLRSIKKEFLSLPCQAIRAKLHQAVPDDGKNWTKAATTRFYDCTYDKHLYARIVDKKDVLSLELIDTNGEDDVYIADILNKHNKASYIQVSRTQSSSTVHSNRDKESTNENTTNIESTNQEQTKLQNYYQAYYKALQQVSIIAKQEQSVPAPAKSSSTQPEEKVNNEKMPCLLKCIAISEGIIFHIIHYKMQPYVTSTDISNMFWDGDILRQMLRQKGLQLPKELLIHEENKELFTLLARNKVNGVMNGEQIRPFITIYHLQSLPEMLALYPTKYAGCKEKIELEITKWKSMSTNDYWISKVSAVEEIIETRRLKLQSLKFKRKRLFLTMMTNCAPKSTLHELQEIEIEIAEIEKYKEKILI